MLLLAELSSHSQGHHQLHHQQSLLADRYTLAIIKWDDELDMGYLSSLRFPALQFELSPSMALQRLSRRMWPTLGMGMEGHDGNEVDLAV